MSVIPMVGRKSRIAFAFTSSFRANSLIRMRAHYLFAATRLRTTAMPFFIRSLATSLFGRPRLIVAVACAEPFRLGLFE